MSASAPTDPGEPDARDFVQLAVNGVPQEVRGEAAMVTLSDFLREHLRLIGTKIVCSEGDCGACTVLIGEPRGAEAGPARFEYRPVDACIAFVYQFDGCHVITVDGLARIRNAQRAEELHPVQRAMAEHYGSQCGFCTPGFVMAIAGLAEELDEQEMPADPEIGCSLSGNLCRCTGYLQVVEAVRAIDFSSLPRCGELFDDEALSSALAARADERVVVSAEGRRVEIARTPEQALQARAQRPQARVVAGATDLGVHFNKALDHSGDWLWLPPDLTGFGATALDVAEDGRTLRLGALTRWSEVEAVFRQHAPDSDLLDVLDRFGGPQIRNMGTVGGNLINASPIADSLPFFYVCDAELELVSQDATRKVPIAAFYRGYKTFDLRDDELLQSVSLRLPEASRNERVLLLKASRRRDLDISTFAAALWLETEGTEIVTARLAYGGVAPTVVRLPEAERALVGIDLLPGGEARRAFERAGDIAAGEIDPISDVRGAAAYRSLLARNVLLRFHARLSGDGGEHARPVLGDDPGQPDLSGASP